MSGKNYLEIIKEIKNDYDPIINKIIERIVVINATRNKRVFEETKLSNLLYSSIPLSKCYNVENYIGFTEHIEKYKRPRKIKLHKVKLDDFVSIETVLRFHINN